MRHKYFLVIIFNYYVREIIYACQDSAKNRTSSFSWLLAYSRETYPNFETRLMIHSSQFDIFRPVYVFLIKFQGHSGIGKIKLKVHFLSKFLSVCCTSNHLGIYATRQSRRVHAWNFLKNITKITRKLFDSDSNMYIGICVGNVPFTRKQYITNTSLVINNSILNCEHVV